MAFSSSSAKKVPLAKWQIASLIGTVAVATGATGTMAYRMASAEPKGTLPQLSADETRLLAKVEESQLKRQNDARKLKQADIGAGYQVDPDGNLVGPAENADLPQNKALDDAFAGRGNAAAEIGKGILRKRGHEAPEEPYGLPGLGRKDDGPRAEEKVQRAELEKSMLGYSTVKGAKWATLKPDTADDQEPHKKGSMGI